MEMRYEKVSRKVQGKSYEAERYIIHLLNCALHDKIPENKPEKCSWKMLYAIAKKNNVENCISPAINNYCGKIPGEIIESWKQEKDNTLYRQLCFEIEREQILRGMEENGISYLLLKGILIANYYPAPGMRWFCDNDILYGFVEPDSDGGYKFRGTNKKEQDQFIHRSEEIMCNVMVKLGYDAKRIGGEHDIYQKAPFFNFELHHYLGSIEDRTREYYYNPWKRAIRKSDNFYQYFFSDEDEYIYLIAHAYKHFAHAGCGIRTLVDEYVILQSKSLMNWNYIKSELRTIGIEGFEEELRRSALHAFSEEMELEYADWSMIHYMFGSGTYGTMENLVNNELQKIKKEGTIQKKTVRWQYIKNRIFIEEKSIKEYFPVFYKYKVLQIFLPVYRILRGIVIHPRKLLTEYKIWKGFR